MEKCVFLNWANIVNETTIKNWFSKVGFNSTTSAEDYEKEDELKGKL